MNLVTQGRDLFVVNKDASVYYAIKDALRRGASIGRTGREVTSIDGPFQGEASLLYVVNWKLDVSTKGATT